MTGRAQAIDDVMTIITGLHYQGSAEVDAPMMMAFDLIDEMLDEPVRVSQAFITFAWLVESFMDSEIHWADNPVEVRKFLEQCWLREAA